MSPHSFKDCDQIEGVRLSFLHSYKDDRGWLCEIFRKDDLEKELHPEMGYISATLPKMSRGPHEHEKQTDIFCFPGFGKLLLVLWDNRPDSPTFGARISKVIEGEKLQVAVVPPGVIHAYANVGDETSYIINFPNRLYRGNKRKDNVDEIRHEDEGTFFAADFKRIIRETKG